ncbi:MAG TPA: hypothetical protein VH092_23275 [Urbifossiella sp.]|jgi:hypothetical protein|nr:hypothetical protein [Urbifossiella sp.]
MAHRYRWLALVGILTAGEAATAAPVSPRVAVPTPAAVREAARPAPAVDFTRLFDRLTIPLGTVPVCD